MLKKHRLPLAAILVLGVLLVAGCSSEPAVTVADTSYTIEEIVEHYRYQDRKPDIFTLTDAESYLEAFGTKTLLETAARDLGYYDDPTLLTDHEALRRQFLVRAYQNKVYSDISVSEEELDRWVERNQSTGVWAEYLMCSSRAKAEEAYERLQGGESFASVCQDLFYLKGLNEVFRAQAGGRSRTPIAWRPVPRNETLYELETGEISEPLFYDLNKEWVYYIIRRGEDADPAQVERPDAEVLRSQLRSEVTQLRRREAWLERVDELRSRAEVEVNEELVTELDNLLEKYNEWCLDQGLMPVAREALLSLTPEQVNTGVAGVPGEPDEEVARLVNRQRNRRTGLVNTLSPFFEENADETLVTVDGVEVPLRYTSQFILEWLTMDDTRLLMPDSREELLQRFVDKSVEEQLAVAAAEADGLAEQPRMLARLQRKLDEAAVSRFFEQEFNANRPRPTEDEVSQYYEANKERFVHDEKLVYQLFTTTDRELAEEVQAVLSNPDNYSLDVEPVKTVAEAEQRLEAGEPLHNLPDALMRLYVAELSDDVATATGNKSVDLDEADPLLRPGFEHETGWLSPVLEAEREGEKVYGVLYVVDIIEPQNRTLENDNLLYDSLVMEMMQATQNEEFDAFISELKQTYPVTVDLDQAPDLLEAVMDLATQRPEE